MPCNELSSKEEFYNEFTDKEVRIAMFARRKHAEREMEVYEVPKDGQKIAKIDHSRGNYLYEVCDSSKDVYLVSMPSKFRKTIWARRGTFVVVQPIVEGDKVKAEIVKILTGVRNV